ncbi:hypothetical protein Tco_0020264 [Tanacetum coccineum]
MQKNLTLIAKYFKNIYKPTNNNIRTSSNSRNKNVDTTLRYKNDNQIGNQRTVTVARARETETKKGERLYISQGKDIDVQMKGTPREINSTTRKSRDTGASCTVQGPSMT